MARYRSILAFILVIITTLLVSCGSPTPTVKGPLYTTTQLEQIQRAASDIEGLRERLQEVPPLIQAKEWNDVITFIHGPLGELREKMIRLARTLTPTSQQAAQKAAREVFEHLNEIDTAAQARDANKALLNYNEALKDFEAFFKLLPS